MLIRFPLMVIEGKAYATGKQIFEAQNQAAVSGSCMTNLQHKLADLAYKTSSESATQNKAPLAFSICTEGPYMELWAHYITLEEDIRMYEMKLLKICHMSLLEGVENFLAVVDNVMRWASSEFVNYIAEQLVLAIGGSR